MGISGGGIVVNADTMMVEKLGIYVYRRKWSTCLIIEWLVFVET